MNSKINIDEIDIFSGENGKKVLTYTKKIYFELGEDGLLKRCPYRKMVADFLTKDKYFMLGKIFANDKNVKVIEDA